jgi:hypothetical protein
MNRLTCGWKPTKVILAICLMVGMVLWMGPLQSTAAAADLILKISRLKQALDLIDSLGLSDTGQPPTAALRGMLQNVEWIDNERSIVLSWDKSGDRPLSALLVPYRQANPDFKQAYNAISRNDYYILSLPPGKAVVIPESIEKDMAGASREGSASTVSMTLALRQVIDSNRDSIINMLDTVGQMSSEDQVDPLTPTAEETRQMLIGLVDVAEQIDLLSLSLDLNEQQFKMVAETVPVKDSDLSAFFAGTGVTTRLDAYRPAHDIIFRSRSYQVDSALDMLDTILGPFYKKLGIDFADLISIGRHFTGETAGGMTYGSGASILVESMAVLKDDVDSKKFMEKVYLPWAEEYGKKITRVMEKRTGKKMSPVLTRTPDSTVGGHRANGVQIKLPVSPMPLGESRQGKGDTFMTYDMRTAVVGNLMLMAPSDARLAEMIRTAESLRKKTSYGPMMTMEVNLGKYLSSLARFIPGHKIDPQSIPDIGTVSFVTVAGGDRVISSAAMETDDIRMMMAYMKRLQSAEIDREAALSLPEVKKPEKKLAKEPAQPTQPIVKDAGYWIDQGGLAATYGAYESAIRYYKKALAMGADEGWVYFNMGIAYGELGDYPQALVHLGQAIQITPDEGAYYYGRARVYLLSGEKDMAMEDFERAADLGDLDALQYLEGTGQ